MNEYDKKLRTEMNSTDIRPKDMPYLNKMIENW